MNIEKRKGPPCKEGGWKCVYCGDIFETRKLYMTHKKEIHKTSKNKAWNKGLTKHDNEILKKCGLRYSDGIKNGRIIPSFLNKHHSIETKKILSNKEKLYINNSHSVPGRSHSIKACKFIDHLNKEYGWHLQHALNGGEIKVDRYYLDGYDKELNIAFEYDEQRHNSQKESDEQRQKIIKSILNCRFFRYDEEKDLLYEI